MLEEPIEEQYRIYFGRSDDYYYEKTLRIQSGKRFSFNPYALIFGLFWLLYRKQYKTIFLFTIFNIVVGIIEILICEFFGLSEGVVKVIEYFTTIGICGTALGFYVNQNYIKNARKKILRIVEEYPQESEQIRLIEKSGGITLIPFLIIFLLLILFILLGKTGMLNGFL